MTKLLNSQRPSGLYGTPALKRAFLHCQQITQEHSKTFYFGSRFFPKKQRVAVWAVYAACRSGDDIADEGHPQAKAQLDDWWKRIQKAFQGEPSGEPSDQALSWAAGEYAIPLHAFFELHQGLCMDLQQYQYHNMEDLLLYCRRVAGVIGFMIAPISGYQGGEKTLQHALKLGQAMQLTNILRDVGEDLERGRLYLPQTLLQEFDVQSKDIQNRQMTPEYRALIQHLIQLTRGFYQEGRQGIPYLNGSAKLAVQAAAHAYEGILDDLEHKQFDNFHYRAFVSGSRKIMMLPRAWWELKITASRC